MKTKTKRIRIQLASLATRDDAESVMNELAVLVNSQRKVTADRDAAVLQINERCAPNLSRLDERIKLLTDQLRAWSEANPSEFPKGLKSIKLTSGTLGFRTGTPRLSLLNRAWNWAKSMTSIKSIPSMRHFIRVKEEIDKDAILSARSAPEINQAHLDEELRRAGLRVTQDESFFIEPDLTKLDSRQVQTSEAA